MNIPTFSARNISGRGLTREDAEPIHLISDASPGGVGRRDALLDLQVSTAREAKLVAHVFSFIVLVMRPKILYLCM